MVIIRNRITAIIKYCLQFFHDDIFLIEKTPSRLISVFTDYFSRCESRSVKKYRRALDTIQKAMNKLLFVISLSYRLASRSLFRHPYRSTAQTYEGLAVVAVFPDVFPEKVFLRNAFI